MKTLIILSYLPGNYELAALRILMLRGSAPGQIVAVTHGVRKEQERTVSHLEQDINSEYADAKLPTPTITHIYIDYDNDRISDASVRRLSSILKLEPSDTEILLRDSDLYADIIRHRSLHAAFSQFRCISLSSRRKSAIESSSHNEDATQKRFREDLLDIVDAKEAQPKFFAELDAHAPRTSMHERIIASHEEMREEIAKTLRDLGTDNLRGGRDDHIAAIIYSLAYTTYIRRHKSDDKVIITQDLETMAIIQVCLNFARRGVDPILIVGPTGTGKELFACLYASEYAATHDTTEAFIAVNASTIQPPLLESMLFGHRKGAFTGATEDQKGLVSEASGGVLFLDEINSIPHETQAKLLRFIETRKYTRVGDTKEEPADVKLIFAANQDLETLRNTGIFREDFYHRISHKVIRTTPLSERPKDIAFIAKIILNDATLSPRVYDALTKRSWPGNVRELLTFLRSSGFQEIVRPEAYRPAEQGNGYSMHTIVDPDVESPTDQDIPPHGVAGEVSTKFRANNETIIFRAFDHIIRSEAISSDRNLNRVIQGYLYSYSVERFGNLTRAAENTFIAATTVKAWKKYLEHE